ncbi:MAG TPA: glucose/galactose MFS transporter [Prolixibacteraceae bacterium]|nr:glucose/galactose MFS transporter [Prolixibacteraceae bacterium]HCU62458.1 glucose/galactose MFS transporter [Prolixibacteraceae bacterium]
MFAVLGFALGINAFFVPFVKEAFHLSTAMSYLIMTATFFSFVVFGIPSGMIIKKIGYRRGMVVAFLLMAAGCFLIAPAASIISFPLFLFALFVSGMGQALLTGAVNTYVTILGSVESAAKRISIMGICNKFSYAGASFILAWFLDLSDVRIKDTIAPFYLITGILIIIGILSYFAPLPEIKAEGEDQNDDNSPVSTYAGSKTSIFQFPHLLLGTVALFLDMGLETIALGTINDYATILNLPTPESYVWFTSLGMVMGYLLGVAFIPKILSQNTALVLCTILGVVTTISIALVPAGISIYLVAVLGLANSLLWPAIWPLAIADLGKYTQIGSSFLVMGMIGGAILPLIFGFIADTSSYPMAYFVCIPAYLFILHFGTSGSKIRTNYSAN